MLFTSTKFKGKIDRLFLILCFTSSMDWWCTVSMMQTEKQLLHQVSKYFQNHRAASCLKVLPLCNTQWNPVIVKWVQNLRTLNLFGSTLLGQSCIMRWQNLGYSIQLWSAFMTIARGWLSHLIGSWFLEAAEYLPSQKSGPCKMSWFGHPPSLFALKMEAHSFQQQGGLLHV